MKKIIPTLALGAILSTATTQAATPGFNYHVDRFADIEVLRYEVPGFENLSVRQKAMIYYLSQAAQMGRDIIYDQQGKYNLQIRQLLENIYTNYNGDKTTDDFIAFEKYLKLVWFGNGIHHHYSTDKFIPEFSQEFFIQQANNLPIENLPLADGETKEEMIEKLATVIFDPTVMPKKVNQDSSQDVVATSATNLYEGVTQAEVEAYYADLKDPNDTTPISYGLNAKVIKVCAKIEEELSKKYSQLLKDYHIWSNSVIQENSNPNKELGQTTYITYKYKEFVEILQDLAKYK